MRRLFLLAATLYVLIYAFEAPLRYALNSFGMDNAIFIRDGLLDAAACAAVRRPCHARHDPSGMAGLRHHRQQVVHGSVGYLNFHSLAAPVYGAKFLLPVLFGFILSSALTEPDRKLMRLLALVWLISLVALYLDKYVLTFPWSGMETTVGGLKVDISRGWDITSGEDKRVAGFARSSIDAAALLPVLAFVITQRCRFVMRVLVLAATGAAIFLTTQKGALLAFAAVAGVFVLPRRTCRHTSACCAPPVWH